MATSTDAPLNASIDAPTAAVITSAMPNPIVSSQVNALNAPEEPEVLEEPVEDEDEEDEEQDDEEEEEEGDEPEYIWLSPKEFADPNLPSLFNTDVNPLSTRTHARRQKSAKSVFPHLADSLYRCKEYPHGIYINAYGELCPDDKRSGLYQIDERATEQKEVDDAKEDEEGDDEEQEEVEEQEDADNDGAPDVRDEIWVDAENSIRAKKGLKRKKVVPDEEEDDYEPSGSDEDDEDGEHDDDGKQSEGDAEMGDTDDEFKEEELAGTDEDDEWDDENVKKKSKTSDDDEDDDDEKDSQGNPLPDVEDEFKADKDNDPKDPKDPKDAKGANTEPKPELTLEERKAAYFKSLKDAEEMQENLIRTQQERQKQRLQDQKNLRLLEDWSEDWKKIRARVFRAEKAAVKDPEERKKVKNTSIIMDFDAHILSKKDPGCDFTFKKPRPKKVKGEPLKAAILPDQHATFDCSTSEVICHCQKRFSDMESLYQHVNEHFIETKLLMALQTNNVQIGMQTAQIITNQF